MAIGERRLSHLYAAYSNTVLLHELAVRNISSILKTCHLILGNF